MLDASPHPFYLVAGTVVLSGLLALPLGFGPTAPGGSTLSSPPPGVVVAPLWGPSNTHLQHIITVVMENRVYDNYFGTYCTALGAFCSDTGNGIPSGTCVPYYPWNASDGCITPYNFTPKQFVVKDMPHDWLSGPAAWDGGAMDGFYLAEAAGTVPFGHFNGTTLPIYWDMAEEYATSDNFFAGNLSYSLPNHWDLVADQFPSVLNTSYIKTTSSRATYLHEAENVSTIEDLLEARNVSWTYYDYSLLPFYEASIGNPTGSAYDYWNPLAARVESYASNFTSHFAPRAQFLQDITNHTLPSLAWVVPQANESDHPGYNVTQGESWVAQLVNAVENSSYWNSTAIFVIWDDYGGWYDHVAPPVREDRALSFRSPILVISPWARENYISHVQTSFFSLLRFEEWQFGLSCLGALDCTAPMPFDFFDFNQSARAPLLFETNWLDAGYPIPLQPTVGVIPERCVSCSSIVPGEWSAGAPYVPNPRLGD